MPLFSTMTTILANDLEIQQVIDEDAGIIDGALDEIDEEELISELNDILPSDWVYAVEEEQAPSSSMVEEEQAPSPVTLEDSSFAEKRKQLCELFSQHKSFAEKRKKLCELFSQRLKDGNWTFQASMPRKGRDPQFDDLLHQLGLTENRLYASTQWRKFKQDKGIFPPPSFEVDPEKLMIDFRRRIEKYTVEKVVAGALAATVMFPFQPQTVPPMAYSHFFSFAFSPAMKIKLVELLWEITEFLASTIAGATNRTIEEKTMQFRTYVNRADYYPS
jgi:hypothetical protein